MGLRNILLGALVVCGALATAGDADAFWGSRGSWGSYGGSWGSGGSYGSSGSWGSSGSSGSWGSNGSSGSWGSRGSHGGFFKRHWARKHGSSGGSWGSSGGSYGSSGSHGSSGSWGSNGSHGGSYSAPVEESAPVEAESTTTTLKLNVPADAKVTLAGVPTKQTGEAREFATRRLAPGQTWSNYNVHVEVTRDGKTYSQDRTILLTGGQSQELSFNVGGMQLASKN